MANWTVDTVDQIQTTGSTVASQVVNLTITNVINGVYNGYNLSASDFKIGGATESPTGTWTGGNVGSPESNYSATFDGLAQDATGDLITFTQTSFDVDGAKYSFAFWAKKTNATDDMIVLGRTGAGANSYYSLIKLDGTTGKMEIESDTNGDLASATVTDDTNWHHYVVTVAGGTVVMYQDGVAKSVTGDINGNNLTMDSLGGGGLIKKYKGQLYQVAIWNNVLDADAVTAIYNSGVPIPLKEDKGDYDNSGNLIHLWRFSEGSGATTADSVGSLTGTFADDATFSSTTPDYRSGAVSKVVFSDNSIAGDPANTIQAAVYLNSFTCPLIADTIYIDIDEATAPTQAKRDTCFKLVGTTELTNETVSNTNISGITITNPYTTTSLYSGPVNSGVSTKVAETEFTADSGYHYSDPPLGVNFSQNTSMLSLGFDYTNQYHVTTSKTYTNNLVTSFIVRIFYTPGQQPPLFPDPDNICEFNHIFNINRRLLQTTSAVTNTIKSLAFKKECTHFSQTVPITVYGVKDTQFTLQFTKNTSLASSAVAGSNGYFNFTTKAFQTAATTITGTIGSNGKSVFNAVLPDVTAKTNYSVVLASVSSSTIPTNIDTLGEQTITQYGLSCITIKPLTYNGYFGGQDEQPTKEICKPEIAENINYTPAKPKIISATIGNNNTSSTQVTLKSGQAGSASKITTGMKAVGLGASGSSSTHNLKVTKIQDKIITLSSAAAVADATTINFVQSTSDVIPFELDITPQLGNTRLSVSDVLTDPEATIGIQPNLTQEWSGTTFTGHIAGLINFTSTINEQVDDSTTLTLDTVRGIVPGMTVNGDDFSDAVVLTIDSIEEVTLSKSVSAADDSTVTFTGANTDITLLDVQAVESDNIIKVQGLLAVDNIIKNYNGTTAVAPIIAIYIDDFIRTIRV